MNTAEKTHVLELARHAGRTAIVDAVPDPTEEGLNGWKEDLMIYFGCAADNLISDTKAEEGMRPEILEEMKEGFKELLLKQPFVEVPLNPMEPPPRDKELKILDAVFSELPFNPHHCTH